ncbi:MAG: hypothetical protein ACYS21_09485 [Planctomycetota bacterium]|jgi:hypothetical protein
MLRIFPVETDDDLEAIRELLVEYAASLGFALCFQNFEEELAVYKAKVSKIRDWKSAL